MAADVALDPQREEAELRAYLGDDFRLDRLQHYQDHLDAEFAEVGHEDTFYLTSKAYLYNLTAFAMTGTKLPYLSELTRRVPAGATTASHRRLFRIEVRNSPFTSRMWVPGSSQKAL